MRKKIDGLLLGEKVEKQLKRAKKQGLVYLQYDDFFKEENENGVNFQIRRIDLMDNQRLHDVIDEIEVRVKQ